MTDDRADTVETELGRGEDVAVDPRLLEIIVCPLTKGTLHYDRDAGELVSKGANLAFPIRNGIPIMLIDEARDLS